jgi:hypothetical protein
MEARILQGIYSLIFAAGCWAFLSVHGSFKKKLAELETKIKRLPCDAHMKEISDMAGNIKALIATTGAIKDNVDFIRSRTL